MLLQNNIQSNKYQYMALRLGFERNFFVILFLIYRGERTYIFEVLVLKRY